MTIAPHATVLGIGGSSQQVGIERSLGGIVTYTW
jgi:hypothetical protein